MPYSPQENYRCPSLEHTTGCRQCGVELPRRRAYCSEACQHIFEANHFWPRARSAALKAARPFGPNPKPWRYEWEYRPWFGDPLCVRCWKFANEVNHKTPVNGRRVTFDCLHHQENLEALCHDCHVDTTNEQRRLGLIGKPRPAQTDQIPLPDPAA